MSKILALIAYRASPHNNFLRYFSPFRNDFGNLRLWLDGQSIRGAGGEETVSARQGVCASFNLAAENCCNCSNIMVKKSPM